MGELYRKSLPSVFMGRLLKDSVLIQILRSSIAICIGLRKKLYRWIAKWNDTDVNSFMEVFGSLKIENCSILFKEY